MYIRKSASSFFVSAIVTLSLLSRMSSNASAEVSGNVAVYSNCVVQLNNTTVYQSITVCPPESPSPAKAIRVTYFWLDSQSASYLMADKLDERLQTLLGRKPILLTNQVSDTLNDLINRFGSRVADYSKYNGSTQYVTTYIDGSNKKNAKELGKRSSSYYKQPRFGNVKVYDAEQPILWPDTKAVGTIQSTAEFPKDYQYYFRDGSTQLIDVSEPSIRRTLARASYTNDDVELLEVALTSMLVHWRQTTKEEFRAYDANLQLLSETALKEKYRFDTTIESIDQLPTNFYSMSESQQAAVLESQTQAQLRALISLAGNRSIGALQHFTEKGVPPQLRSSLPIL